MIIKILGKYELLEELGRGGFGTVYLARDSILDVERAVKILHPQLMVDPDYIHRFRKEARTAARLDHPNIVPIYEVGEEQGSYFLVMKYLPGGSLKELIIRQNGLSYERSLEIINQVASALDAAHQNGLVHRDVKPGNILFDKEGRACLTDFGFARALSSNNSASLSSIGGMIGTPSYMAPEIWSGKTASPSTDVYSLACVLYETLTGNVLFKGDSPPEVMTRHMLDGPQFPAQWPEGVPVGMTAIMQIALAKDPADRYAGMPEFIAGLKNLEVAEPLLVATIEETIKPEQQVASEQIPEIVGKEVKEPIQDDLRNQVAVEEYGQEQSVITSTTVRSELANKNAFNWKSLGWMSLIWAIGSSLNYFLGFFSPVIISRIISEVIIVFLMGFVLRKEKILSRWKSVLWITIVWTITSLIYYELIGSYPFLNYLPQPFNLIGVLVSGLYTGLVLLKEKVLPSWKSVVWITLGWPSAFLIGFIFGVSFQDIPYFNVIFGVLIRNLIVGAIGGGIMLWQIQREAK